MTTNNTDGNKRFSHTRELVKLAIEDGLSQTDIAKMCRTSQSVVSGWANGASRAKVGVIRPLIERYGNRLSRVAARYYIAQQELPPGCSPDSTELGQRLKKVALPLSAEGKAVLVEILGAAAATVPQQEERALRVYAIQELFDRAAPPKLVRVEGPIVFRHVFRDWCIIAKHRRYDAETVPWGRCIVHSPGPGQFHLVVQRRRWLRGTACMTEHLRILRLGRYDLDETGEGLGRRLKMWDLVDCVDDEGRWIATVDGPLTLADLVRRIDLLAGSGDGLASPSDSVTLPLLARKAFMQLGYTVPDLAAGSPS